MLSYNAILGKLLISIIHEVIKQPGTTVIILISVIQLSQWLVRKKFNMVNLVLPDCILKKNYNLL